MIISTKKLVTKFLVATLVAQVTQAADCQHSNLRWNQACAKDGKAVTDPMAYIAVSLAALLCCACCHKPILAGFAALRNMSGALFKDCSSALFCGGNGNGNAGKNSLGSKLLPDNVNEGTTAGKEGPLLV